jgi:hypothetical protein
MADLEEPEVSRWVSTEVAARKAHVDPSSVVRWAQKGYVLGEQNPGPRGAWRIALDARGKFITPSGKAA